MTGVGLGKRVQVFIGEGDSVHGRSLATTILDQLRKDGAAGAVVTRGIAGFGVHGQLRVARLADLAAPLPLVITWIDTPDRVERLLPGIAALVHEGLIVVDDVEIVRYSHRDLAALDVALRVADVMTRAVVAVTPETPLTEVVDRVLGQSFRSVPVVGEDGQVVGIITNTDLVERGDLPARVELLAALDPAARRELLTSVADRCAADVMTLAPIVVRPDAPVARAIAVMLERRVKRLPVADADGRLVGIVSRADVLRALSTAFPVHPATSAPAAGAPGAAEAPAGAETAEAAGWRPPSGQAAEQPPGSRVAIALDALMQRFVPVVREDARLAEVLDAVVSTRLNRAVVIDAAGRVRGVVGDGDVLRCLEPPARRGLLGALMRRDRLVPPEAARLTAADVMGPAALATPATTIEEAARQMIEGRHKIVVVADEQGVLLGMVDRADLLARAGR